MSDDRCGNCGETWEAHHPCDDELCDCEIRWCPTGHGEFEAETDEDRLADRTRAMGL